MFFEDADFLFVGNLISIVFNQWTRILEQFRLYDRNMVMVVTLKKKHFMLKVCTTL